MKNGAVRSVDGTMYSLDYAKERGPLSAKSRGLPRYLIGVCAVYAMPGTDLSLGVPEPTPFANISEHEIPVAWCGMIDYEVNNVSASKHVAARPFKIREFGSCVRSERETPSEVLGFRALRSECKMYDPGMNCPCSRRE
eukprot:3485640-Rhodomonas_salina.4